MTLGQSAFHALWRASQNQEIAQAKALQFQAVKMLLIQALLLEATQAVMKKVTQAQVLLKVALQSKSLA